jgi:lipid-binding SYLF domain-containing protein
LITDFDSTRETPMRTMERCFKRAVIAALVLFGLVLSSAPAAGASAEIDAHVRQTIEDLYRTSSAAKDLAGKSAGMLVFPNVVKGGFVVGAEYGEGALLVGGKTAAYYSIASGSLGLQIGVQEKSVVLLFMTAEALAKFRASQGWKAGVDGSVALASLGAGDAIDTETLKKPIIGFVFNNKGLMANLTLEGSKITRIDR